MLSRKSWTSKNLISTTITQQALCLTHIDGRLFLGGISLSTPDAEIARWWTRIKGMWLIKIGPTNVSTIKDAQHAFKKLSDAGAPSVVLLFLHPEIRPAMTHNGLPIVSSALFHQQVHDQLNRCWDFKTVAEHLKKAPPYILIDDRVVLIV
jgi:hypothetical protein